MSYVRQLRAQISVPVVKRGCSQSHTEMPYLASKYSEKDLSRADHAMPRLLGEVGRREKEF